MTRRTLTDGELQVLALVQSKFGAGNTEAEVVIHGMNEAVIWAQDDSGSTVMMVNLTVLAGMQADGTISDEAELVRDWLGRV